MEEPSLKGKVGVVVDGILMPNYAASEEEAKRKIGQDDFLKTRKTEITRNSLKEETDEG
jgi:hypothetical protein